MARSPLVLALLAACVAGALAGRELNVFIDSEPVQTSIAYDPAFPATGKQLPFSDARLVRRHAHAHLTRVSVCRRPKALAPLGASGDRA